jgi:hypothetical protein
LKPQRGRSALVALVLSLPSLGGFFFCGVNYFRLYLPKPKITAMEGENLNCSETSNSGLGAVIGSFTMQDLMLYYQDKEGLDFTSKVVDVLNCMVNDR